MHAKVMTFCTKCISIKHKLPIDSCLILDTSKSCWYYM